MAFSYLGGVFGYQTQDESFHRALGFYLSDSLLSYLSALVCPDRWVEEHSRLPSSLLYHPPGGLGALYAFRRAPPCLYHLQGKGYLLLPKAERNRGKGALSLYDINGTAGRGV